MAGGNNGHYDRRRSTRSNQNMVGVFDKVLQSPTKNTRRISRESAIERTCVFRKQKNWIAFVSYPVLVTYFQVYFFYTTLKLGSSSISFKSIGCLTIVIGWTLFDLCLQQFTTYIFLPQDRVRILRGLWRWEKSRRVLLVNLITISGQLFLWMDKIIN